MKIIRNIFVFLITMTPITCLVALYGCQQIPTVEYIERISDQARLKEIVDRDVKDGTITVMQKIAAAKNIKDQQFLRRRVLSSKDKYPQLLKIYIVENLLDQDNLSVVAGYRYLIADDLIKAALNGIEDPVLLEKVIDNLFGKPSVYMGECFSFRLDVITGRYVWVIDRLLEVVRSKQEVQALALKSEYPEVRLAATKLIDDEDVLREVALKDNHHEVSKAATERLTNQAYLAEIISDKACSSGLAFEKLTDQYHLFALVMSGSYFNANGFEDRSRLASVISKITDVGLLKKIVMQNESSNARMYALGRIEDHNTLTKVALEGPDLPVKLTAIRKITDDGTLIKIAKSQPGGKSWAWADERIAINAYVAVQNKSKLVTYINESQDYFQQRAAFSAIKNRQLLEDSAANSFSDYVRNAAQLRLKSADRDMYLDSLGYAQALQAVGFCRHIYQGIDPDKIVDISLGYFKKGERVVGHRVMTELFYKFTTKTLAEHYYNYGGPELSEIANDWAKRNGYMFLVNGAVISR
ncbi:MAG: hypothetical protein JMN27_15975 [gamma proteobacterium endosymbiont of Lamellibrachia anaximandri]|nr:hypothetical protein [gamma proteobacterium endosymbiont of Lamellibrachia anaximandri]MBL3535307.1 hypothetical protein [gamma proteobacterium endosymbiont of Lamellibrachia anaximandri]